LGKTADADENLLAECQQPGIPSHKIPGVAKGCENEDRHQDVQRITAFTKERRRK